jgi:microcystin-dependent protein
VSPYIETILDDVDAATARATLGIDLATIASDIVAADATATAAAADATAALALVPSGSVQMTIRATAPSGWLLLDGSTIGDSGSGAGNANAANETLFGVLWDSMADAQAPVSGGRGASAAADWAAGKTITLPDARGRAVIGSGTGSSLTARTHGGTLGAETHTLSTVELPSHSHSLQGAQIVTTTGGGSGPYAPGSGVGPTITSTSAAGGDGAHNNMQPSLALNLIVKL